MHLTVGARRWSFPALFPLVLCVGPLLLAGCLVPGRDGGPHEHEFEVVEWRRADTMLVLEYTLANLDTEMRAAEPGHHCGAAWLDDGHVEVQRYAIERAGTGGAYLFVDPWLKGDWAASGDGPLFLGLPTAVDAKILDDPGPWTQIATGGEEITVDGQPVELPHHWHVEGADAKWRIDARLTPGPLDIGVIEDVLCE